MAPRAKRSKHDLATYAILSQSHARQLEDELPVRQEPQVFISYQRSDEQFARRVREHLASCGLTTWMDQFDIPVGAYWPDEIDKGLSGSDIVVGVLSPDAVASRNVKNEWDWAIANTKRLVLIQVTPCVLPHRYIAINFIDATGSDQAPALSALVDALGLSPSEGPSPERPNVVPTSPARNANVLSQELACATCGARLTPGSRFCNHCGAPVTDRDATPPPTSAPSLPASFASGRYTVVRFLGEGGKKRVYHCYDTLLDRDVAFALLKTDGLDTVGIERVRREAKIMGRLGSHPHIVSVYDLGDEDGHPYLVSELLTGGDVAGLLAASPDHRLSLVEGVQIAGQVCLALAYAHDHGIIHRDLKPGNVWLTSDGAAKLGDFGLALTADTTRLSTAGTLVGTVGYLAPEQVLGKTPDPRSDIYGLGAMLYEFVTGRPPFVGDDPVAIISQHLHTPPVAPRWHNPSVPEPLDALLLQLLAKDPTDRPADAATVHAQLTEIASLLANRTTPSTSELIPGLGANPLDRLAAGVFVGRDDELDRLRSGVEAALSGRSQVLLIVGEPGIGKTRLAEELSTYAGIRGAQVLWGRSDEWEGQPAYWPWIQLIRGYVHLRDARELRSELGSAAPDIAQIVSEIRERLTDLPAPPPLDPDTARFRLFDGITTFFTNASARQPLVLILDDLHWADKPSLLLLEFLTNQVRDARLLLVATYRDVEVGRHHPLSQTLAELSRGRRSQRVLLRGLSEEDVARYLSLSAGIDPPTDLVTAVHRETEGNPFFVAEVVRLLVAEGRIGRAAHSGEQSWSVSLPESVREVVGKRLSRLSEECNRILTISAVIGRDFNLPVLQRVADLATDPLIDALDEACQSRMIEELPAIGGYRFAHALVQETLVNELSIARRVRLHRQIGEALELVHARDLEHHYAELAYHFFQSAPAGHISKAIDYTMKAGDRAVSHVAWESAVEQFERARQLLDLLDAPDPSLECNVLLALGEAREMTVARGDTVSGQQLFRRAADLARMTGNAEQLARAALGFGGKETEVTVGGLEQVQLLEEALSALNSADSLQRVRLLARLATDYWGTETSTPERSKALSDEAVAMARRIQDPTALAFALTLRQSPLYRHDNLTERLQETAELMAMLDTNRDPHIRAWGTLYRWFWVMEAGDSDEANRACDLYVALGDLSRMPLHRWAALLMRALYAFLDGRFADAETLMNEARSLWPDNIHQYSGLLLSIRHAQGRVVEVNEFVEREYRQHVALYGRQPPRIFARIQFLWLDAQSGYIDRAQAEFEVIAEDRWGVLEHTGYFWLGCMGLLAETCSILSDVTHAAALEDLLRPYGERILLGGNAGTFLKPGWYYLGLLATVRADWTKAEQYFSAALAMAERMDVRPFLVDTQIAFADMLLNRDDVDDRDRARALIDQAGASAQELGMAGVVEHAQRLQRLLDNGSPDSN
jgi:tetratricopeptide (TPR) repeat protein